MTDLSSQKSSWASIPYQQMFFDLAELATAYDHNLWATQFECDYAMINNLNKLSRMIL